MFRVLLQNVSFCGCSVPQISSLRVDLVYGKCLCVFVTNKVSWGCLSHLGIAASHVARSIHEWTQSNNRNTQHFPSKWQCECVWVRVSASVCMCVCVRGAGYFSTAVQLAAITLRHGNVNQLPPLSLSSTADNTEAIVPPNTNTHKHTHTPTKTQTFSLSSYLSPYYLLSFTHCRVFLTTLSLRVWIAANLSHLIFSSI